MERIIISDIKFHEGLVLRMKNKRYAELSRKESDRSKR